MISIIIPVLNESETIEKLLEHLALNAHASNISEVVVVDGGSTDGTQDLVTHFAKNGGLTTVLIPSEKGRARQMNAGTRKANGNILYFLHADSLPPKNFDTLIISKVKEGNSAGCFRMKFDSDHLVLKVSQWFTRFNYKICRGGDQSLFITKEAFNTLQGFDTSYAVYEDCEFINRIYDRYKFAIIKEPLTTSARKYEQVGTTKLQYYFIIIHLKKILGASAENLSAYYQRKISS